MMKNKINDILIRLGENDADFDYAVSPENIITINLSNKNKENVFNVLNNYQKLLKEDYSLSKSVIIKIR